MNKGLLSLSALALATVQAQAASEVTLVSVTPDQSTTINYATQEFVVEFSAGVELDTNLSTIWSDAYNYGAAYYVPGTAILNHNEEKTVWTIALDESAYDFADVKSGLKRGLILRFGGKDLNGEELAGPNTISYVDWSSYTQLQANGWEYIYTYEEIKPVFGVSDISLVSLTPAAGTHVGRKGCEFTATFTGSVRLDQNSYVFEYASYYSTRKVATEMTANADSSVWTLTFNTADLSNPDSIGVRVSGTDSKGDSLQVGAIKEHIESWYDDPYDIYYWQNVYPYGTTCELAFEPQPEEGDEIAKLDILEQFTLIAGAGATINSDCQATIEVMNYKTYKTVAELSTADAQMTADGTFVFTLAEPITEGGVNYMVNVPDGFFIMPDDELSRDFSVKLYIRGVVADYKPSSINPAEGYVTSLTTIDLSFYDFTDMDVNTAKAELLDAEGNVASTISWGYKGTDGLGFVLTLDNDISGKYGNYTLVIAEGSFGDGTWNDEIDADGNHLDGHCNPELKYSYTLYDENNIQLTGYHNCQVEFYTHIDFMTYTYEIDTIDTRIEFYDNGSAIVKKWAGVVRYDLAFNMSNGVLTQYDKIEYPESDNGYTYCTVATGREDIVSVRFAIDGWNVYDRRTISGWWSDYYRLPDGTVLTTFTGFSAYNAEGETVYPNGQYIIYEFPEDEAIEAVKADVAGDKTVRFYHLNGAPASADAKGMLIMRRGSEVSRIFKM